MTSEHGSPGAGASPSRRVTTVRAPRPARDAIEDQAVGPSADPDGWVMDDLVPPEAWLAMKKARMFGDPDEVPAEIAAPFIVAAAYRRMAEKLEVRRLEMREEDGRTIRSSGMGEAINALLDAADELTGQGLEAS